jgi:hypothetical protein
MQVVGSDADSVYTWAAGERGWTTVVRSTEKTTVQTRRGPVTLSDQNAWPNLLDASYRSADLEVAYYTTKGDRKTGAWKLRVVRGNARGARARIVGSLDIPASFNGRNVDRYVLLRGVYATFVPGGLVAVATFESSGRSRVIAAFVPLGR